jgi:murein DD-endopeptidase MepM/ murein hydrolase activator NlpD
MPKAKSLLLISLVLLVGCSSSPIRGSQLLGRVPSSALEPNCSPSCAPTQVCMNTFKSFGIPAESVCVETPSEAPNLIFTLPFSTNDEAICTHSSGSGSHSSVNAFFALDLATDYSRTAATIRASAAGKVYLFTGKDGKLCAEPSGAPASAQGSDCGDSWGNHVMIYHGNGYASFYVHLDHFLVANGASVHQGDPIGVEGWTGAAGHRHVHWSVQKLQGSKPAEWEHALSLGWTGISIPFHFSANQNGTAREFDVTKIQCAQASIGGAPTDQQPKFRGVRGRK